jgi:magnesium transporter
LFVVLRTARYLDAPEEIDVGEIQVFANAGAIVIIRHGEPVPLARLRARLEADAGYLAGGPVAVLHAVIDEVVDAYQHCLSGLDDDVSEVELDVFADHHEVPSGQLVERIYFLQREVLELHRALHPLAIAAPNLRHDPLITADPHWDAYFRDIEDHLQRHADQVLALRDLLGAALSANATQISLRQNEDMRRISAWVAIVAVPTMVAGIYGMNFDHMPELGWVGGYPFALAIMVVSCFALYRLFRRSGWL